LIQPRDYQLESVASVSRAFALDRRVLLVAPTACHGKDEPILMFDGTLKMSQEINVGDILMGHDGTPRRVIETHSGITNMYKVIPDKFEPYIVSKDHLLCLYRTKEKKDGDVKYEELKVQDWDSKTKSFKHTRYLYRSNKPIDFKNDYKTKVSPYVLGSVICDCSQLHLTCTKNSQGFLKAWEQEAKKFDLPFKSKWNDKKNTYEFKITSDKRVRNEFHAAVRSDLSDGLRRITHNMKTMSIEDRLELAAGLLDGDGYYDPKKHSLEFTFKQKSLVEDCKFLFLSLGLHCSIVKKKLVKLKNWDEPREYYRIYVGGPVDITPSRDYDMVPIPRRKNHFISRFKVEEIPEGDYYGWSVDGDMKYLNSDFQVIHNSGKSVIIALMVKQALERNKSIRILVLCHQGHLLSQNEKQIHRVCGEMDTGIYCASEGRKEFWNQIILASRDSLGRNPEVVGEFDLIIVDEAHLIDLKAGKEESDTYYSRIIKAQKDPFVVGLTGTPWRLGNGSIVGPDCFFKRTAYEIKMDYLIEKGHLCSYRLPFETKTIINAEDLKVASTGDYREKDLEEISATAQVVGECLDYWEKEASECKVSLFFCCSRIHAGLVKQHLMNRLAHSEVLYIDGDLTGNDRKSELKKIQDGHYRAIVNIGVLTTGFDAPIIDCIVLLRATASASLFVQMSGRGLRNHPGKTDCLMLDMAGNFDRFKSLSEPYVREPGKKSPFLVNDGGERYRECPSCGEECAVAARQCPECLHIFINHTAIAKTDGYDYKLKVVDYHFEETYTKNNDFAYVVHYKVDMLTWYQQYFLVNRREKWADLHRKQWLKFKLNNFGFAPSIIQVRKKPGSNYPDIKVLKWDVAEMKIGGCSHRWVDSTWSAHGGKNLICMECGEGVI